MFHTLPHFLFNLRLDIESKTLSPFIDYTFGAVDNIRRSDDGGLTFYLNYIRLNAHTLTARSWYW